MTSAALLSPTELLVGLIVLCAAGCLVHLDLQRRRTQRLLLSQAASPAPTSLPREVQDFPSGEISTETPVEGEDPPRDLEEPADLPEAWNRLPIPKRKMLCRVRMDEQVQMDGTRGFCIASNKRLARDWHGPGRPCHIRTVQRILSDLAKEGHLRGWGPEKRVPTEANPVGRYLSTVMDRMGPVGARPLSAEELGGRAASGQDQGGGDTVMTVSRQCHPPMTSPDRKTSSSGTSNASENVSVTSGVAEAVIMKSDPKAEAPGPQPRPTASGKKFSSEENEAYHLECVRRRTAKFLVLNHELKIGESAIKDLDGRPERRNGRVIGWLFPSSVACAIARGQVAHALDLASQPPPGRAGPVVLPAEEDEDTFDEDERTTGPPPASPEATGVWRSVASAIFDEMGGPMFDKLVAPLSPVSLNEGLVVYSPAPFSGDHVAEYLQALICRHLPEHVPKRVWWSFPGQVAIGKPPDREVQDAVS